MKKVILTLCCAAALAIAGVAAWLYSVVRSTVCGGCEYVLLVDQDDSEDSIRTKLQANATGWDLLAWHKPMSVRTGRYVVPAGSKLVDVYRRVRNHQQDAMNLTVPEVRLLSQLPARLAPSLMTDSEALAAALADRSLIDSLGFTPATLPAMFIPNTYNVWWNMSSRDFVLRMHREWLTFWDDDRRAKAQALGLTPVEVSTLASIVEGETANNAEKPVIAGLYINRLKKGMLLQSDPTVIFAVGDFSIRRVLNRHLAIDSPYNTYRYAGLPPGPIRVPSIAGIDAVLNHTHHNYIYMCAKEDFSGTHNFAATLAEHNANARRYVSALNRRGIR